MTDTPLVSVVVPVRDPGEGLRALLRALWEQTLPAGAFEVVVVDDGSRQDVAELTAGFEGARVIRRVASGGSYAARNDGIAAALGRAIAFTDGDCRPAPDWLERGLAALAGGEARLVAGEIEVPLGRRPSSAALVDYVRFLDQSSCARKGFGATANLLVNRDVFTTVGLFNPQLRSGGDAEFGHRAAAAGERIRYCPDAVVRHDPRSRGMDLARKGYRLGYANAEHRLYAEGPLRERARICTQPGNWLPRRRLWGLERLNGRSALLTRRRILTMHAAQYLCLQLPMVAGSLVGTLRVGSAQGHGPGR